MATLPDNPGACVHSGCQALPRETYRPINTTGDAWGWWVGSVSLLIAETRMPTAGIELAVYIGSRIQCS